MSLGSGEVGFVRKAKGPEPPGGRRSGPNCAARDGLRQATRVFHSLASAERTSACRPKPRELARTPKILVFPSNWGPMCPGGPVSSSSGVGWPVLLSGLAGAGQSEPAHRRSAATLTDRRTGRVPSASWPAPPAPVGCRSGFPADLSPACRSRAPPRRLSSGAWVSRESYTR